MNNDSETKVVRKVVFADTKSTVLGNKRKSVLSMTRKAVVQVLGKDITITLGTFGEGSRGGTTADPLVLSVAEWRAVNKKIELLLEETGLEGKVVTAQEEAKREVESSLQPGTLDLIKKLREMREASKPNIVPTLNSEQA